MTMLVFANSLIDEYLPYVRRVRILVKVGRQRRGSLPAGEVGFLTPHLAGADRDTRCRRAPRSEHNSHRAPRSEHNSHRAFIFDCIILLSCFLHPLLA